VMQPLTLDVWLEGIAASRVDVDFAGVDMNMGFNRPQRTLTEGTHYRGEGMLPVCVRESMEWEAKVLALTDKGLVMAPFRFTSVKSGSALPGH